MSAAESNAERGETWRTQEWVNRGGIYEGHDNHGNCHGGMDSCNTGWNNEQGHVCLWIGADEPLLWLNYGPFVGGRYPATIWVRPAMGGENDGARFNSEA